MSYATCVLDAAVSLLCVMSAMPAANTSCHNWLRCTYACMRVGLQMAGADKCSAVQCLMYGYWVHCMRSDLKTGAEHLLQSMTTTAAEI